MCAQRGDGCYRALEGQIYGKAALTTLGSCDANGAWASKRQRSSLESRSERATGACRWPISGWAHLVRGRNGRESSVEHGSIADSPRATLVASGVQHWQAASSGSPRTADRPRPALVTHATHVLVTRRAERVLVALKVGAAILSLTTDADLAKVGRKYSLDPG